MSSPPTRIQVCGHLVVELEGQRVENTLPGRQGRLLLAYLVLNRGRPVRRDELVEALWAEDGQPASGDALLRPPLSRLRKALGPGRLEGRGELTLVLPEGAEVDWEVARAALAATRAALSSGDWRAAYDAAQTAVEIAGRGLLPGLEADWIEERRRELEDLRIEGLEAIAVAGVALGGTELSGAERAARAAVEAAPFRESARAALMEALGAAGNIAEALRAYDDLRTMLRDELGTAPSPRVVALYERLLTADKDPDAAAFGAPAPTPRPPRRALSAARHGSRDSGPQMIERDHEVALLTELLDEALAGQGRVAVIEGPAGIGKSRLLSEVRLQAEGTGTLTLTARGSQIEREFPFGVVRQLFEGAIADPAERDRLLGGAAAAARTVFEAADDSAAGDTSFASLHGLFWLCVNLAAEAPLVVAVDDLHWVDRPSLRFLAYLTQRLEGLPVFVVSTLRTGDAPTDAALVAEIAQDPAATSISPRPLTEAAVAAVVRERLGAHADDRFCQACHRATVGNPLLLRQILRALEADAVPPDAEHAHVVKEIGQGAVSRSVLLRLERLGGEATAVARAVSVLGENAELPAIASLAELDERGGAEAAAALARAEILRPERPPGFVHPLVRDAVYHDMPLTQRELLHTHASRVLTDLSAPAEQIAAHLLMVPRRNSPWVSAILQQAAIEAVRKGGADSAVAYLRRALDEPPAPSQVGRLLIDLGLAEWLTNGPAAAEHLQQGYAGLEDPVERAVAAEPLGRALLFTAQAEQGAQIGRDAMAALPPGNDDLRDRLEAFVLVTTFFGVNPYEDLERLRGFAPPPPGAPVGQKMLAGVAALTNLYAGGRVDDSIALCHSALEGRALLEADNGLISTAPMVTLAFADRYEESLAGWEAATADGHRRGSLFSVSSIHLWRGFTHLWHGDLREAESMLAQAWASFDLFGYGFHAGAYRSAFQAWIRLERGDLHGARESLHLGEDYGGFADGLRFWLETRIHLLMEEGRYEEAIEVADQIPERFPHSHAPPASRWRVFRAEALAALDRTDEALAAAEDELEAARASGAPTAIGRALRVLGAIQGDDGFAHLWEAVDVLANRASRLEYAKALHALGRQLRSTGLPQEAVDHLGNALELAEILGAGALSARVREELVGLGVEPSVEAPSGVSALSETERRVAALAAEGQSAREIAQALYVTPASIDNQLGGVFRKLGISSPDELAPVLAAD